MVKVAPESILGADPISMCLRSFTVRQGIVSLFREKIKAVTILKNVNKNRIAERRVTSYDCVLICCQENCWTF